MDYTTFIESLRYYQTETVKVFPFPNIFYPDSLPEQILPLFSEIITVLQAFYNLTRRKNKEIVIIGLQPPPFSIESKTPSLLNRIYNKLQPRQHLSCCIQFLSKRKDVQIINNDILNSQSFFVDFTTGEIADANYYLDKLFNRSLSGNLYGNLSEEILTKTWASISDH